METEGKKLSATQNFENVYLKGDERQNQYKIWTQKIVACIKVVCIKAN